ncbi:hypothetical protein ABVG11_34385 [Streptomyces sp. HD1123-B1]|uniref:hypothetical protein n=1 Tax=Streptomyces huangiella TaxID=3228804 RepID=UPI003D7ED674
MHDLYIVSAMALMFTGAGAWVLGLVLLLCAVLRALAVVCRAVVRRLRGRVAGAAPTPAEPRPHGTASCPSCGSPAPAATQ